jgi:hypothetical protein
MIMLAAALCSARSGWAQALPVARGVLALDSGGGCDMVPETHSPLLVLTTEGIARHNGDGSYAWLCPSRWGGARDVRAATDATGRDLWVVADGALWTSGDSGCTGSELALPGGAAAVDVMFWRSALWVLTGAGSDGEARLLRRDGEALLEVASWPDFRPDGMAPDGPDRLWLAGALPEPQVRRLSLAGGLTGDAALPILPEDRRDLDRLLPVAAADGEAWFVARRRREQWTWHARVDVEDVVPVVTVTDTGERAAFLAGPARLDGEWLISLDGSLHTAIPGQGAWTPTGATVAWISLAGLGERVFAGSIEQLGAILELKDNGEPRERPVWTLAQVAGPGDLCAASAACDADWAAAAEVAGLDVEADPAVCPDGRTADDLNPSACACDSLGTVGWLGWVVVPWWRRRRVARSGQTCSGVVPGGSR